MFEDKEYYALTRKVFDLLAPYYEIMTLPLMRVRDQVVDFTNARPGSTILDVATGTGQQALAFAKRGFDVIAVDLTESMLAIARKHNIAGLVRFETADATQLRFEDHKFEVSCISFALHDMPPRIRDRVLGEMLRVTKRDGMIVIVDHDLPHNRLGRALIYRLISLYEGKYYRQFISMDLNELLRKAGIQIVAQVPVLFGAGRIIKGKVRA